jgi:tetratricopeptide (TPR) repeat protein
MGECAPERVAARTAIEAIKCDPVLFEATGARPHPARITYLEGLARSQICVIIWKESYGWIDPAIEISGIEDEFRIARERHLDILLYIKSNAPDRDPRLTVLIDEARTFVTTHNYQTEVDLHDQISSDITALLSAAYIDRIAPRAERLIDPSAVLTGTLPVGVTVLDRPLLEQRLHASIAQHAITWLIGAAGAGKTVLLAQWSIRHRAAYVNGRDLSLRHLLQAMTSALSGKSLATDAVTLEDASKGLKTVWRDCSKWPLVIDDPSNIPELMRLISELGTADGKAHVVLGARIVSAAPSENVVTVPGLTSAEAAELIQQLPGAIREQVSERTQRATDILPLAIRREAAAQHSPEYLVFDDVGNVGPNPVTREILALIVASPEPLMLEDLVRLSSADETAVTLDGHLASISFLLVDDGLGFRPVHDEIADELRRSLARRPALERLVSLRLAQFFAKARRYLAAFSLYRSFDKPRALRVAYRAAIQATHEGRFGLAIEPLQFIVEEKKASGERLDFVFALISLSQAQDIVGETANASAAQTEAEEVANAVGDHDLIQRVADQSLLRRVRHQLRPEDLVALRAVRQRYREAGRVSDSARLAAEEGSILISIGDHENSIPVLREARDGFLEVEDNYGIYVATRNLIASLNMIDGGQAEAEQLLQSLKDNGISRSLRERAWMCNILARRYRLDNRLEDAISVAQEAIDIGKQLNDPYVVSLNRIALGNALRQNGNLTEALASFRESGKEAQAIDRKEIDGLASRLASSVLIQQAEQSAPYLKPQLYNEAEVFATHVIGLLRGSIAEVQVAEALDSRGDARLGLGRKAEALSDFAESAKLFFEFDENRALRLVHYLGQHCDINDPLATMNTMLSAIPGVLLPSGGDPWVILLALIGESIMKANAEAVGLYARLALNISQTIVSESLEVGLWLRLLTLALDEKAPPDDGRMAFVLSAFLAHSRARNLSLTQLTALTELTLGQSKSISFHSVAHHLQTSFTIGAQDKVLIVLDDIDGTRATRFCSTALTCFFIAFRKDIEREFLSGSMDSGLFIRCSIVDAAQVPDDLRAVLEQNADVPVTIAMFDPKSDRPRELIIACREDLQERCRGDTMQATDLQFMYADVLRALMTIALGGDIEPEVLRPKIVALIKKTIQ